MQSGLFNYSETKGFQQALFADPRRHFSPQELEKVSGQPLPDYVRDHILTPLGMSHTSFPTTNAVPEPHPKGYTVQTADGAETNATDWDPSQGRRCLGSVYGWIGDSWHGRPGR
jgi:D-alanyl-D-alanine carboxypeptidase